MYAAVLGHAREALTATAASLDDPRPLLVDVRDQRAPDVVSRCVAFYVGEVRSVTLSGEVTTTSRAPGLTSRVRTWAAALSEAARELLEQLSERVCSVERIDDTDVTLSRSGAPVSDVLSDDVEPDARAAQLGNDARAEGVCAEPGDTGEARTRREVADDRVDVPRVEPIEDVSPLVDLDEQGPILPVWSVPIEVVTDATHRADPRVREQRYPDDTPDAGLIALAPPDRDREVGPYDLHVAHVEPDQLRAAEARAPSERDQGRIAGASPPGRDPREHRGEFIPRESPARRLSGNAGPPPSVAHGPPDGTIVRWTLDAPLSMQPRDRGDVEADRRRRAAFDDEPRDVVNDGRGLHWEGRATVRA